MRPGLKWESSSVLVPVPAYRDRGLCCGWERNTKLQRGKWRKVVLDDLLVTVFYKAASIQFLFSHFFLRHNQGSIVPPKFRGQVHYAILTGKNKYSFPIGTGPMFLSPASWNKKRGMHRTMQRIREKNILFRLTGPMENCANDSHHRHNPNNNTGQNKERAKHKAPLYHLSTTPSGVFGSVSETLFLTVSPSASGYTWLPPPAIETVSGNLIYWCLNIAQ